MSSTSLATWLGVSSSSGSDELLDGALDWQDLNLAPVLEGDEQVVTMDRETFEARFFRLRKP